MTIHCPCCNQLIPSAFAPIEALEAAPWTRSERRIVEALAKAYPRAIGIDTLIDALYFDDPNGGPDTGYLVPAQMLVRIRRKIGAYGWVVPKSPTGRGSQGSYRLEPLRPSNG